jgi:poly(3-hydroxybutyrate) depolymerase
VAEGSYYVVVPDGVDPATAPMLAHLHHSGQGQKDASREAIQTALAAEGLVGLFPQGWGDAQDDWNVGDNRHDIPRDDVAFLLDVAIDVVARYQPASLWLGGGSKGGAMTYELGCLADDSPFDGFLPIAGAVEKPLPRGCTHPSRPIRHLEGIRDDDHWPEWTADRPESSHMGIMDSFLALTTTDGSCMPQAEGEGPDGAAGPFQAEGHDDCVSWACADTVALCWYDGGHSLPSDWVHLQATAIKALSP